MFITKPKIIRLTTDSMSSTEDFVDDMDYEEVVMESPYDGNIFGEVTNFLPENQCRKRMKLRLHQLTWEEKIQRKKLRNRIAAQTSRDRKKAKMDYLEETVKELQDNNNDLYEQVAELKRKNESLTGANAELQKLLSSRSLTCSCAQKTELTIKQEADTNFQSPRQTCVTNGQPLDRPAESSNFPQQKGLRPSSTQCLTKMASLALWQICTLYLLSQKCWQISKMTHSSMNWTNWQRACLEKLKTMETEQEWKQWQIKSQMVAEKHSVVLMKWWGKHQQSWNPVEVN